MKEGSQTAVRLHWLSAGYCTHPEWTTIRGGALRQIRFPAGFALIQHPTLGPILFDTGYASRFYEAASKWPYRLYRAVTPVHLDHSDDAATQLRNKYKINPEDVKLIIVSHFHADHIGGLRDFPNAHFLCFASAYEAVRQSKGWTALLAGFLPGLMPEDFALRSTRIRDEDSGWITFPKDIPFSSGYDLLGDGSLLAVKIPGHAHGQMGVFLRTDEASYFLCADAVWSSVAFRERRPPHPLARIIMSSSSDYKRSFDLVCALHERNPQMRILPSHCLEAVCQFEKGNNE